MYLKLIDLLIDWSVFLPRPWSRVARWLEELLCKWFGDPTGGMG